MTLRNMSNKRPPPPPPWRDPNRSLDEVGDEPEPLFRRRVIKFAKQHGWIVFYTPDSGGMTPGEFDLRLVRPPRYVVAELKSQHGRLRTEQKAMRPRYEACPGIETYVWYPSDQPSIRETLE